MPLPQPLHIFRKDLTHLWPETLFVLALFAAFAWAAPSGWTTSQYSAFAPLVSGFLKLLMPIAWLVLISRLVHDEPLVGDRQFWTSRPYHWAKLLAAKLLYLAVFLYLPFLAMQMFLLLHAGLHPTLALPALFYNLLLLTVIVVVPLTALAAVTSTFARLLLTTLGVLILLGALLLSLVVFAFNRLPPPALWPLLTAVFVVLPLGALVHQYATRRTAQARLALAATPVLAVLLVLLVPATALVRSSYPLAGPDGPVLSPIAPEFAPHGPATGNVFTFRNQVELALPFSAGKTAKDSTYLLQGAALTIDAAGTHVSTPYATVVGQFDGSQPVNGVNVPLPQPVFEALKDKSADVHLSLAVEQLEALPAQTWKATLLPFAVPGNGLCSFPSAAQLSTDPAALPLCRYPFKTPQLNVVQAPIVFGECGTGPTVQGGGTIGGGLSLLDFDPVVTAPLRLRPAQPAPPGNRFTLCPGTPLTFIEARSRGRMRLEVDEKQLLLNNYAVREQPVDVPERLPAVPQ